MVEVFLFRWRTTASPSVRLDRKQLLNWDLKSVMDFDYRTLAGIGVLNALQDVDKLGTGGRSFF